MTDSVESVLQKSREAFEKWGDTQKFPPLMEDNARAYWWAWEGWQASRSALEPMLAERNMKDGECHICKTPTELIAGDPGKWPMWLGYYGGNGKTRPYHRGCVIKALHDREAAEQALREAQAERDEHESWLLSNELAAKTEHARANGLEAGNEKLRELLREYVEDDFCEALEYDRETSNSKCGKCLFCRSDKVLSG